jgi:hypothetical protein
LIAAEMLKSMSSCRPPCLSPIRVRKVFFRNCSRFQSDSSDNRLRKSMPEMNFLNFEASILPAKDISGSRVNNQEWSGLRSRLTLNCQRFLKTQFVRLQIVTEVGKR